MDAEDQGGKGARLIRWSEAEHDEFLAMRDLDLEPSFAASGAIGAVGALRDDAFKALLPRHFQHGGAIAVDVIAIDENAFFLRRCENLLQAFLAFEQGFAAPIGLAVLQQVESVVDE